MAVTLPGLPEYPPGWQHGAATADLSWSAAAFNAWWLLRLLVACVEWLAADIARQPWLLAVIGVAGLVWWARWRWGLHWWWALGVTEVAGALVVLPSMSWVAGGWAAQVVVCRAAWWLFFERGHIPRGGEV